MILIFLCVAISPRYYYRTWRGKVPVAIGDRLFTIRETSRNRVSGELGKYGQAGDEVVFWDISHRREMVRIALGLTIFTMQSSTSSKTDG